ncbi:hypothetical protein ATCC90586_001309 [Pythium insidiosum]|nr:hypothetical protein ATCC90586_001309 [Pythium insidiosum]
MAAMVASATTSSFSPRQHKLRTFIVLNAKSSRGRLASFSELLDEPMPHDDPIPDECLAFESYAAVATRFKPSSPPRELRWSDLNRPRFHLASFLGPQNNGKRSQKARRRHLRRARSSSGSLNDHLEVHALELCFEFLDIADLQRATLVCTEFREVVIGSARLLLGLYGRKWRTLQEKPSRLPREYHSLDYASLLAMYHERREDFDYSLMTRSRVTKLPNSTYEIVNNSLLRVLTNGAVDSVRGASPLPVLSCAAALKHRVSYFEVAMQGCGSVGIVSLSDAATRSAYGFGSDEHIGWKGISYGYHGNDGDFVYNDGTAPYGGEWKPFGPSWGTVSPSTDDSKQTFTVGCGVNMTTHQVFFTLNGTLVGVAPVTVPDGEYAAAVSLHEFNDSAVLNAGSAPFKFDIEGFCASLQVE